MQNDELRREQALEYHASGRPGKIEVIQPKKPKTQPRPVTCLQPRRCGTPCLRNCEELRKMFTNTPRKETSLVSFPMARPYLDWVILSRSGKPVMEGKGVLVQKYSPILMCSISRSMKRIREVCADR